MKINIDLVKRVVADSFTYNQVLLKLGRSTSGSAYQTFKKVIRNNGISTTHFLSHSEVIKKSIYEGKIPKWSNESIFIKNSMISRSALKKRVIVEGLIEYKCHKCGADDMWHGERITLILDHINGDRQDNRIDNLRFMCPNCNSTLPTHCIGLKSVKKKEKDKKTIKIYKPRYDKRKAVRPNKKELIKMINKLGYVQTGKAFGVSDNAIRKWLKSMQD